MTTALYHASCADGFCAAWIFRKFHPEAEFIPVQYGKPAPEVKGDSVYILDFSYPREELLKLKADNELLVVLDHHKTAEENLKGLDFCVFDMNKSGAWLTLEFMSNISMKEQSEEWLVDYTEDRDLWKWSLPNSKEINAAIRTYPFNFEVWDMLSQRTPESIAKEGEAVLRLEKSIVESHVKHASPCTIGGLKVPCVNATTQISEIGNVLSQGHPFAACWFYTDTKEVQFSLRSQKDGEDVAKIAESYMGGGHKNAAGFRVPIAIAMDILGHQI